MQFESLSVCLDVDSLDSLVTKFQNYFSDYYSKDFIINCAIKNLICDLDSIQDLHDSVSSRFDSSIEIY